MDKRKQQEEKERQDKMMKMMGPGAMMGGGAGGGGQGQLMYPMQNGMMPMYGMPMGGMHQQQQPPADQSGNPYAPRN